MINNIQHVDTRMQQMNVAKPTTSHFSVQTPPILSFKTPFLKEKALLRTKKFSRRDNIIIVGSENWYHGVIGIVASKITELYYKPSILVCFENEIGNINWLINKNVISKIFIIFFKLFTSIFLLITLYYFIFLISRRK